VSIVKFRNAVLLFVSDGSSQQVYLDGVALTGVTTSATPNKVRVAIPDGVGGYTCFDAGLTAPSAPSVAAVSGGTGLMAASDFSLRIRSRRHATDSYSNSSAPVAFSLSAGEVPQVTFPAANVLTEGQDEWVIEGTKTAANLDGPWYQVQVVTEADVAAAGRVMTFEWSDGNLIKLLADNMFPPPLCTGIACINDYVLYWGCGGTSAEPPGPIIAIADPENPEHVDAFSRTTAAEGESILEIVAAEGRLGALTMNSFQTLSFSGGSVAFAMRKVYASGFMNRLAGCIANNTIYLFTGNGAVRSRTDQDVDETFAIPVKAFFRLVDPQYVVMGVCPKNRAVVYFCYFLALDLTLAVPFMLDAEIWSTPMPITGQVVSAVAVGDQLEMRVLRSGHYREVQFDYGGGTNAWWVASHFIDAGAKGSDKTITNWQVTGEAASIALFQAAATFPDVSDLAAAQRGAQTLQSSFRHHPVAEVNYAECKSFALRVDGTTSGQTLEEIAVWLYAVGGKR
jgi:hypothetical protein